MKFKYSLYFIYFLFLFAISDTLNRNVAFLDLLIFSAFTGCLFCLPLLFFSYTLIGGADLLILGVFLYKSKSDAFFLLFFTSLYGIILYDLEEKIPFLSLLYLVFFWLIII